MSTNYQSTISGFKFSLKSFLKILKKIFSGIVYLLLIILISAGIRIFLIEIYSIPSDSMEDTLLPGDVVLVSKLNYGARLPASPFEIPWINIAFYLGGKNRNNTDSAWWDYHRMKGLSGNRHNQVVVFNKPNNRKEIFIKRCMGIPGDTIWIKNTQVYANDKKIPERNTVKFVCRVLFNNYARASSLLDSLDLNRYYNRNNDTGFVSLPLSIGEKQNLLQYPCIDSVIIEKDRPDTAWKTFPRHDLFHWTIDDFGPLVIPEKGMTIILDEKNYALYKFIINSFERDTLTRNKDTFYINGEQVSGYTFKYDYYFMLGDNRHDSNDSRYWGFVSEQCIIGKALMVLFSGGERGFRRERILKVIR